MGRETRFELATLCLGSRCATIAPLPPITCIVAGGWGAVKDIWLAGVVRLYRGEDCLEVGAVLLP